jgi:hypothetical protein
MQNYNIRMIHRSPLMAILALPENELAPSENCLPDPLMPNNIRQCARAKRGSVKFAPE